MNTIRPLFLLALSFGMTALGNIALFPVATERVPTQRNRTDTFPRWQDPTSIYQSVELRQGAPPGSNPRMISSYNSASNSLFESQSMAVDSRNVVHTAGLITFPGTTNAQIVYFTNSHETRTASGFSVPLVLASYIGTGGPFGYSSPAYVDVCMESGDSVRVTWVAYLTTVINGNQGGFPYSVNRVRADVFSIVKGSTGWGTVAKLTTTACTEQTVEQYGPVRTRVAPNGNVRAAGYRRTYNYVWSVNQWIPANPANVDDVCFWSNIPTTGMPTVIAASVNFTPNSWWSLGFAISPSGESAVAYGIFTLGIFHINSRRTTGGGVWQPPFDVCGSGGAAGVGCDVTFDSMNQPHYVFLRDMTPPGSEYYYAVFYRPNTGVDSLVSLPNTTNINPRVILDSRDNVHVVYQTAVGWTNGIVFEPFYAARVKNPDPATVDLTWRRQDLVAAPVFEQTATNLGGYGSNLLNGLFPTISDIELGRNDQLHCLTGSNSYTCTTEYGLGQRDPAAMAPAFPGASVNVTNGNLNYSLPLFTTQGVSPTQSVSLIYNSLDTDMRLIAPGWRLNYDIQLIDHGQALNDPNGLYGDEPRESISVVLPDGRRIHFGFRTFSPADPTQCYLVAFDEFGTIGKLERTSWTQLGYDYRLTFKDGTRWTFNGNGKLREIRERSGNLIELSYDSGGRLQYIRDQTAVSGSGRQTTIYYETVTDQRRPPRITQIQDPTARSYYFSYSGNDLAQVSLPEGVIYAFQYHPANNPASGARAGLLASYTSPRGYAWECAYLTDGRLLDVSDPVAPILTQGSGGTVTSMSVFTAVTYEEPIPATPEPQGGTSRASIVYDRRGNPTRYLCEGRRNLVEEIYDSTFLNSFGMVIGGPPGHYSTQRGFDTYGNQMSQRDRLGSNFTYIYFAPDHFVYDDLQFVKRDNFTLSEFTYIQDGYHQPLTKKTYAASGGAARMTSYAYTTDGRLQTVTFPQTTLADGTTQNAAMSYEYAGPRGALSRVVNEEGFATVFSNHHSLHGLPQAITRDGGTQPEDRLYDSMGNVIQSRRPRGGNSNDIPGWTYINRDGLYRVSSENDPLGITTTYGYDLDSNVTSVTPPAGGVTYSTFDARGFSSGGSGPDGSWSQWVDGNGSVTRTQDLRGFLTNKNHDSLNRPTTVESEGAGTVGGGGPVYSTLSIVHDQFVGGLVTRTSTAGGTASPNRVTTETMDSWGRVFRVAEPDGLTLRQTYYDLQSNVLASEQNYNSVLQSLTIQMRDARDRVFQFRRQNAAFGSTPTWVEDNWTVFNKTGAVVQTIGPRGNPTNPAILTDKVTYELDERDRVTAIFQPVDGQMTATQENVYGDDDLLAENRVLDPTGVTTNLVTATKYAYTARKEQKSTLNANNYGHTYAYTSLQGQVDTVTDAEGRITKTTYNASTQRPYEVIEAYGTQDARRTVHTWTNGLLTQKQVWNPQTQSETSNWTYDYDRAGRLERMQAPGVAAEVYSYSAFSENTGTVAGAKTEARTYNSLGSETNHTVSGAFSGSIARSYDGAGNLTQTTGGLYRKDFAWDTLRGRPTSESLYVNSTLWKTLNHEYDAGGNYARLIYTPDASSVTHEWVRDDAGRVTSIQVGGVNVCSMAYTKGGLLRLTVMNSASGTAIAQTLHDYDSLGRRTRSLTTRISNQSTLSDLKWEYDIHDRITKIRYIHLGIVTDIGYNFRGEVISEVTTGNGGGATPPSFTNTFGGPPTGNVSAVSNEAQATPVSAVSVTSRTASYVYDKGGNRISQTIDGVTTTLTYDAGSRLTNESGGGKTVSHVYDNWGNETTRTTVQASTTTVETYGYNALNLMSSYLRQVNGNTQANWQYDYWPSGERYSKTNLMTNVGELYATNGDNVVADYSKSSGGAISIMNTYGQGLGLDQKSLRMPVSGGRIHYLGDQVGTMPTTLTDSGTKSEECVRDVWGNTFSGDTNDERYGYAQREHDTESGLVYMRHRMYDPRIGRFTQVDPISGLRPTQHYIYATNNPVMGTDPTGEVVTFKRTDDWPRSGENEKIMVEKLRQWSGADITLNSESGVLGITYQSNPDDNQIRRYLEKAISSSEVFNGTLLFEEIRDYQMKRITALGLAFTKQIVRTLDVATTFTPGASGWAIGSKLDMGTDFTGDEAYSLNDGLRELTLSSVASGTALSTPKIAADARSALPELKMTVRHYTDLEGMKAIQKSGTLRSGTYVTTPGQIRSGMSSSDIETFLEIGPGRGRYYVEFQASGVHSPSGHPLTSGGGWQGRLSRPFRLDTGTFKQTQGLGVFPPILVEEKD